MKSTTSKTPHHIAVMLLVFAAGLLPWHFCVSCDISGKLMWTGLALSSVAATIEMLLVVFGITRSIG